MATVTVGELRDYLKEVADAVVNGKMQVTDADVKTVLNTIKSVLQSGVNTYDTNALAELQAIKNKLNGTLLTQLTGSIVDDDMMRVKGKTEILVFSKDNPLPPRTASDYEIRDTGTKVHSFPHLRTAYPPLAFTDLFDQSFVISSTLDADISVTFAVSEVAAGAEVAIDIYEIDLGIITKPSGSSPKLLVLTPERTTKDVKRATVIELPELRQPFPAFRIRIKAQTTPTQGEIKILNTRRY